MNPKLKENVEVKFTVAGGRQILRHGKPFIYIGREEGGARPVEADDMAHLIARLLNGLGES